MSRLTNRPGPAARRLLLLCVVIPILVALPVWAFAWAAADPQPHDLPIGVAGPATATAELKAGLDAQDGAFDVHTYETAAQARQAIEDREIYGAVAASASGTEVLTASAASPAVAQSLTERFASPDAAADGQPRSVTDVVPADADDPRGSALGSMVLPLVLVSVVTSLIVIMTAKPGWQQVLMIAAAALIAGVVSTAIVQGGLGALSGSWLANVAAPTMTVAAIASALVGLTTAFGRVGIAVVAPLMLFLGNPWAGASSAPHLLPEPAGLIGQLLPPGAGATMLRGTSLFDGAGIAMPVVVLSAWILVGVAAIGVGALRRREPARVLRETARPLVSAIDG